MKTIYGKPYTTSELTAFAPILRENVLTLLQALTSFAIKEQLAGAPSSSPSSTSPSLLDPFISAGNSLPLLSLPLSEVPPLVLSAWNSAPLQAAWKRRNECGANESHAAFMSESRLSAIFSDDFVPSQSDVLLARVRTEGIISHEYILGGVSFEFFDVGGRECARGVCFSSCSFSNPFLFLHTERFFRVR